MNNDVNNNDINNNVMPGMENPMPNMNPMVNGNPNMVQNQVPGMDPNLMVNNQGVMDNNISSKFTPMNEEAPSDMEPYVEEKPKSKLVPVLVIIGLLLLIGIGGFFGYQNFIVKPYKTAVNILFTKMKETSLLNNKYKVTSTMSVTSSKEEYKFLNGIKIDATTSIDQINNKNSMQFSYTENNKKLLDIDAYMDNNKVYIDLKDLYDKVLFSDISEFTNSTTKIEKEDLDYLLDLAQRMLLESLKDEKNAKSNTTVKINGKDVKLTTNSYVINKNNISRITNNMLNVLINDSKAIKILSKYTNKDEATIKNNLQQERANNTVNKTMDDNYEFTLVFYTHGLLNTFAGIGAKTNSSSLFDYYIVDGYSSFVIDNDAIKVNVEGTDSKETIKVSMSNQELLNGEVTLKSKDNYSCTLNIANGITISMDLKTETISEVTPINTTNTIDVKNLTEEDQNKISENLTNALKDSELFKMLNSENTSTTAIEPEM